MLSIVWGLVILGILILRVRNVLHVGLMEAALERSARTRLGSDGELEFCAQCEMPLLEHAAFCNACGTAVRVQAKATQARRPWHSRAPTRGVDRARLRHAARRREPVRPPSSRPSRRNRTVGAAGCRRPSEADERNRFYDDEEGRA